MSIEDQYRAPKLDGLRIPLKLRVAPERHKHAWIRAHEIGISMADYVAALIDRDAGLPNVIDNPELLGVLDHQTELPMTG